MSKKSLKEKYVSNSNEMAGEYCAKNWSGNLNKILFLHDKITDKSKDFCDSYK